MINTRWLSEPTCSVLKDSSRETENKRRDALVFSPRYVFFSPLIIDLVRGKPGSAIGSSPLSTRLFQVVDPRGTVLVGYPVLSLLKRCVMLGGKRSFIGCVFMARLSRIEREILAHTHTAVRLAVNSSWRRQHDCFCEFLPHFILASRGLFYIP